MKKKLQIRIKTRSNRGVAIIFFVMTIGVLLAFLMMIINTGMLVYQKIRLQSSVDLAAYAGAAVQASYLGNEQNSERKIFGSGEESVRSLNFKILKRYGQLINDLKFGTVAPWPIGLPDPASCIALCQAANLANGKYAAKLYKDAVADIEEYRNQIAYIMAKLPEASRRAAEETLRLNIPDLEVSEMLGGSSGNTLNKVSDVMKQNQAISQSQNKNATPKNAALSFSTEKGMYLSSVVAPVYHRFAYFGPACFNMHQIVGGTPQYYCMVNGIGAPGGFEGFDSAVLVFARIRLPVAHGNIGRIDPIAESNSKAIRLHFIQNSAKPGPFFVAAAEWFPQNGSFANIENSLGAKGSLFPTQTRLVAVAGAEPFGGSLAKLSSSQFGVRLQALRRLLLDPRMQPVKEDYPGLFDYFQSFGTLDASGKAREPAEEVIQRFLH